MFNQKRFDKWDEETHIPESIMNMVEWIAEKIGCEPPCEQIVELINRGGWPYAYGKGFTISYCTSSIEDGPGIDYSEDLLKWIKGLGFTISRSYGNNGMDPAESCGRDTYWHHDFLYKPSLIYDEMFYDD
jgi:hypothetical protein